MGKLGIMQGRLSPPVDNKIQAFPVKHWRDEFPKCRELKLDCMEWIFEYPHHEENPLYSKEGIEEMRALSRQYQVQINSVVADYFMEKRLFGETERAVKQAIDILLFLIRQCSQCGIPIIEIPFVDASAIKTEEDKRQIRESLKKPLQLALESGIHISLETSLPPDEFNAFINSFGPYRVFVNYDMGNSASLGYNPEQEIEILGPYIINVHIKDRVLNGGTVPLGEGDTDFKAVFEALLRSRYTGDFIMQTARQDLNGQNREIMETIREYIRFIEPYMGGGS